MLSYVSPTVEEAPWRAPEAVDTIIANSGAVLRIGGDRAFYSPSTDYIQKSPPQSFIPHPDRAAPSYMSHRIGRERRTVWTGICAAASARMIISREELRAEIAQCMLCSELNVAGEFSNTVSYIASWLERLKSDRKEIFRAAADAQRIAGFLLAFHPDYAEHGPGARKAGDAAEANDDAAALAEAVMSTAFASPSDDDKRIQNVLFAAAGRTVAIGASLGVPFSSVCLHPIRSAKTIE